MDQGFCSLVLQGLTKDFIIVVEQLNALKITPIIIILARAPLTQPTNTPIANALAGALSFPTTSAHATNPEVVSGLIVLLEPMIANQSKFPTAILTLAELPSEME